MAYNSLNHEAERPSAALGVVIHGEYYIADFCRPCRVGMYSFLNRS